MSVGMKRKPDSKKPGEKSASGPSSARRLRKLMEQLEQRPGLLEQVEAIVGLAANDTAQGSLDRAEEVEAQVSAATRQLGRQTMAHWAQAAQEQAVAEYCAEHPKARVKKKTP